jgi:hypothetical protein
MVTLRSLDRNEVLLLFPPSFFSRCLYLVFRRYYNLDSAVGILRFGYNVIQYCNVTDKKKVVTSGQDSLLRLQEQQLD